MRKQQAGLSQCDEFISEIVFHFHAPGFSQENLLSFHGFLE